MRRACLRAALPFVAAAAIACDRDTTPLAPVNVPDAAIVAQLRGIGYRGPVLIADRAVTDEHGTRPLVRGLFLPRRGLDALRRADAAGTGATAAMRQTLAETALNIVPDDADPAHNSKVADLETVVSPSRSNGANPVQVTVNYNFRFLSYDYATDEWYTVPAGEVLESVLRARDSSAGHWHGSLDTMQLRLPLRVGQLVPAVGSFTGTWATTWRVAEVSMELSTRFRVREIGGPNDGQVDWFYSFANDGVRVQGLKQMPANTARYLLVGVPNNSAAASSRPHSLSAARQLFRSSGRWYRSSDFCSPFSRSLLATNTFSPVNGSLPV